MRNSTRFVWPGSLTTVRHSNGFKFSEESCESLCHATKRLLCVSIRHCAAFLPIFYENKFLYNTITSQKKKKSLHSQLPSEGFPKDPLPHVLVAIISFALALGVLPQTDLVMRLLFF